jgi:hypothetical protein
MHQELPENEDNRTLSRRTDIPERTIGKTNDITSAYDAFDHGWSTMPRTHSIQQHFTLAGKAILFLFESFASIEAWRYGACCLGVWDSSSQNLRVRLLNGR